MFDQPTPTLEDAKQVLLARENLNTTRQRDMVSAITRIGAASGRPLHSVPVDAPSLRAVVAELHHKQMGISSKSLGNLKSSFKLALQTSELLPADDDKVPLSAEWQSHCDECEQPHQRYALARFMRFCTIRDIQPQKVDDQTLEDFKGYLDQRDIGKDPQKLCKEIAQTWNGLSERLGLGLDALGYEKAARFKTRALHDYPQSLQDDIFAYLNCQQVVDIFDETGPDKPLKPISVRNVRQHLQRYLHALADTGTSLEAMVDLKGVVTADKMKQALRQIIKDMNVEATGRMPPTLHNIGATIKVIAKHHLKFSPEELREIDEIRKKVAHNPKGMSEKNKERLGQFDDWRNVLLMVGLPRALLAHAEDKAPTRTAALDAMYGTLVGILLSAPMRIKNAASLRLDQHIFPKRQGKNLHYTIRIPDSEVKNRQHIEVELNEGNSAILKTYLERFRPLLSDNAGDAPFPRQSDGRPRDPSNLSKSLSAVIRRETGLIFHAHLFRHFAAFLYLSQRPGELETVRRLLSHAKMQTTLDFYAEMTSKAAHERYDETVLRKFGGTAR